MKFYKFKDLYLAVLSQDEAYGVIRRFGLDAGALTISGESYYFVDPEKKTISPAVRASQIFENDLAGAQEVFDIDLASLKFEHCMMEGQRVGQSPNQLPMLVLEEPSAGLADDKVYVFHRQHIYIGRAIENSLVVNESSVSRQHSEITFRGMHASRTHASERWALTDTSRNGTFVNDKLVIPGQTVMLESGDKIAVGSRIFIVRGQPQE